MGFELCTPALNSDEYMVLTYRVFCRFGQLKFAYGGQVSVLSQFSLLPQLPEKTKLASKVVKIDSKIIILRHESKSVTHSA